MTRDAEVVDVGAVLDRAAFSGLPLRVTALAVLVLALDGFDIQAAGFAAPAIAAAWGIDRAELAWVMLAGLAGMAGGSLILGRLADRYGRRPLLIGATLLFATGSLACATAGDIPTLAAWRFVTGIGLGAPLPIATAMIAEFVPARFRSAAVGATIVGVPLGGFIGAGIAAAVVPRFGWPSIFIVGGLLPVVAVAVLHRWFPESPRFLAERPGRAEELAGLLNRVDRAADFRGTDHFHIAAEPRAPHSGVAALLAAGYRCVTLLLWAAFFVNVFAIYIVWNWMPTLLAATGVALDASIRSLLLFNLGGIVGTVLASAAVNDLGTRRMLASSTAVAAAAATAAAMAAPATDTASIVPLYLCLAAMGAGVSGTQALLFVVGAQSYATPLRATGLGAAGTAVRCGGLLAATAGAAIFSSQIGATELFGILASALLVPLLTGVALPERKPAASTGSLPAAAGEE